MTSSCDPCGSASSGQDKILDNITGGSNSSNNSNNQNSSNNSNNQNSNQVITNNNNQNKDIKNILDEISEGVKKDNMDNLTDIEQEELIFTNAVKSLKNRLFLKYLEVDFEFYGNRMMRYRGKLK
jgi:hypothetical protein